MHAIEIKEYRLESQYLIDVLSCELNQITAPVPDKAVDIQKLYRLAYMHNVHGMVYHVIKKFSCYKDDEQMIQLFKSSYFQSIAQDETQKTEARNIIQNFSANKIACMPLKGCILKPLYPASYMRSMSDVDILIKEKDFERAGKLLLELGYTLVKGEVNHDIYYKPPFMLLELHRAIVGNTFKELKAYFGTGWQFAIPVEQESYIFEMPIDDPYVYLMAHLAKHFKYGGIGIRAVMDIWVMNKRSGANLNRQDISRKLEQCKILDFANKIEQLTHVWFENAPISGILSEISDYIISSGTFGTVKSQTVTKFSENNKHIKTKFQYYASLFFLPYKRMVCLYPSLRKHPVLLPWYWIIRSVNRIFVEKEKIQSYFHAAQTTRRQDVKQMHSFFSRCGL